MTVNTDERDFRLPRDVVPTRYELTIAPDLDAAAFLGHVRIELEVTSPTSSIVCNAAELEITAATLSWPGASPQRIELAVSFEEGLERVTFSPPRQILPGPYVLECDFSGVLNDKLRGFYRSTFRDEEGNEHVLAVTQFESTDARRAFPCWDEPDRKAVFSVALEVDSGLLAISNAAERRATELPGGKRRHEFADTIPMSTYLVAFVIGPLAATEAVDVDGTQLRIVHTAGKEHLTGFAIEAARHSLRFFTEYFAQPYPGDKLDLVAIPDFAFGAMENLGCVTFREVELLTDPARSARHELQNVASVIGHELAHMWFGDLVTMSWWNGVWLNESFATYMALCYLDDFKPEFKCWVGFSRDREMALSLDGLHSTRPIEFPVQTPGEVESMFDVLTYEKGASLLRMLEQYLGTDRFRDGVRRYLADHRYGNTETTDLWDAIEASAEGRPIRAMMDSWIRQGGHPLVTARAHGAEVVITQQPFFYLPDGDRPEASGSSAIGSAWLVPVALARRPGPGQGTAGETRHELLRAEPLHVPPGDGTLVVNAGGSGVYRLRYDDVLLADILAGFDRLEPLERFKHVADTWACALASSTPLEQFLSLVRRLEAESEPSVWAMVVGALNTLDFAVADDDRFVLQAFVRSLLGPELERVGWDPSSEDDNEAPRRRAVLIGALGTLGADPEVRAVCRDRFAALESGVPLGVDIASAILHVVAATAGRGEYEALLARLRSPADPLEEQRYLDSLSCVSDSGLAAEICELCLSEIRTQDAPYLLRKLLINRFVGPKVWEFVAAHWDTLLAMYPENSIPRMVEVSRLCHLDADGTPRLARRVTDFLETHRLGGQKRPVEQSLERLAVNVRFVLEQRPHLRSLLVKA
ncbi:MAG: M1 family metallopeptidase [Acidimicrobiales bacterium]